MPVKNKFSINIEQSGETVIGRILEQDNTLRRTVKCALKYVAPNGFAIISYSEPELRVNGLYIRGLNTKSDDNWFLYTSDTKAASKAYYNKCVEALKAWREAGYPMEEVR